jgi:hypothetical protein
MSVKAKLSVILKADEVEVASSEDAELWQQVLLAITGAKPMVTPSQSAAGMSAATPVTAATVGGSNGTDPLSRMATAIGVEGPLLQGACSPVVDAPFMTLDAHRYEAMRKALPERGGKAISNIQIAGTLLGLWFYYAGLGNVTQAQAQAILEPLGKRDPNPGRGIANAHWIQSRAGGQLAINPAEISVATKIAECFCTKDWSSFLKVT